MSITKDDILSALQEGNMRQSLAIDDWRRTVEQYPYCEIFVWHYLRALYRADDISMDDELQRLAIRICNKQAFYNFMVRREESKPLFEYNTVTTDYFAQKGEENLSLTELARRLKAARLSSSSQTPGGGDDTPFCTGQAKKNDIAEAPNDVTRAPQEAEKVEKSTKNEEEGGQTEVAGVSDGVSYKTETEEDIKEKIAILVKQKKYSEALEILKRENFANSKKNAYFAVQIRYIETIINSR